MTSAIKPLIKGRVYIVGDHVDTDVIIPARFLTSYDPALLKLHLFEDLPNKKPYEDGMNIIIAGRNFGCGSSREHAPVAIAAAGFEAVVAQSFARIYWRNSVNGGRPMPVNLGIDITEKLNQGDEITIAYSEGKVILPNGDRYKINPLLPVEREIMEAGGLTEFNRKRMVTA